MNFADALENETIEEAIREAIEEINAACVRHPDDPRDAGVANPAVIASDPIRLVTVEIEQRDTGYATIAGAGLAEPLRVEFYADELVSEWAETAMLEAIAAQ